MHKLLCQAYVLSIQDQKWLMEPFAFHSQLVSTESQRAHLNVAHHLQNTVHCSVHLQEFDADSKANGKAWIDLNLKDEHDDGDATDAPDPVEAMQRQSKLVGLLH